MAHTVSPAPRDGSAGTEPSVGTLVQSAMADFSTLVRAEIELAKSEVGKSAKKAGIAALVGRRYIKKIEKPERTLETLRDLHEVARREAPGERHRAVPEISNGQVKREGAESYTL